jgi:hypothetical protein
MKKSLILFILFFPLFITGFSFAETHSYYLPYFIADPGHWSGVALHNCSSSASASVTVMVYDEDGNEITTENKTLLPRGQEAWVVGVGLNQEGWMKVNSDQLLTGLCFFGTGDYMADITLIDTPLKTLCVPHVAQTSSEWDTTVLVCNPNDSSTTVTLSFVDTLGNVLYSDTDTILSNGSSQYKLFDLVEGSEQPSGSVEISASQGVAAFALYNNLKWGGYCYAGISASFLTIETGTAP